MKKLLLSQAIDGFLLEKASQQLSIHTVRDYTTTFRKFQTFLGGDPPFAGISREQIMQFLAYLRTPQEHPGAVKMAAKPLSKKTILNYHTGLSALWTWAVLEGVREEHLLHSIPRPDPEDPAVVPFSEQDVRALLAACDRCRPYTRPGQRPFDVERATASRDKALILIMLDTGARASELCELLMKNIDLKNRRIMVLGKGDKERLLPLSATTAKALWRYTNEERSEVHNGDPVFVSQDGRPFSRGALLQLLWHLGEKAGVVDCHPHRFRHTFAINFLRNGANAYELQMALGHSTLEMVKRYLELANTDVEAAHKRASPVERWKLVTR